MINTERDEIIAKQYEMSGGWVAFPIDGYCRCGKDLLLQDTEKLITGCSDCNKSFCE